MHLLLWVVCGWIFRKAQRKPKLTIHLLGLTLGAWVAGRYIFPGEPWVNHVGAALIISIALFLWALLDILVVMAWLVRRRNVQVPIILRQAGVVLVFILTGSAILKWGYGFELTGLLATSGIAAVILGFAMQDLLSNVIAGFSIHMTRAYKVGDWLILGDSGERAEVTEINWRSTRLVTNDQIMIELPNSDIVKNRITNLNYPTPEHGVRMQIGLDYDVPPAMAKEALIAASHEAQGVLESPSPNVFLLEYGDSAIIYELRFWMRHARLYNQTCDEIRTALWYELQRRNISIPFPIRTLDIRKPNVPESIANARAKAADIVGSGSVLDCLTHNEAADLVEKGKLSLFGKKEALMRRGEEGHSMFVILDGSVEVVGKSEGGPRVILARMGSGECFGERSLLTGEPRNATVRAEKDTLVLEIRKQDLSPLMAKNPELADRFADLLTQRQEGWDEQMEKGSQAHDDKHEKAARRTLAGRILRFFSQ